MIQNNKQQEVYGPIAKPYHNAQQSYSVTHTHYYLSKEIEEPSEYTEMIHHIYTASEDESIYIHVNTPGGRLDTGIQLINAIQNSQAKVTTILDGIAHSLGTLIFLAGHELIIHDNCIMMFHNFRAGLVGKGNELTSELDATLKWFTEISERFYIPFLSKDELNKIIKGEDIWMTSGEIRKRAGHMTKSKSQQTKKPKK